MPTTCPVTVLVSSLPLSTVGGTELDALLSTVVRVDTKVALSMTILPIVFLARTFRVLATICRSNASALGLAWMVIEPRGACTITVPAPRKNDPRRYTLPALHQKHSNPATVPEESVIGIWA